MECGVRGDPACVGPIRLCDSGFHVGLPSCRVEPPEVEADHVDAVGCVVEGGSGLVPEVIHGDGIVFDDDEVIIVVGHFTQGVPYLLMIEVAAKFLIDTDVVGFNFVKQVVCLNDS